MVEWAHWMEGFVYVIRALTSRRGTDRSKGQRSTLLERNWEGRGDVPRETLFGSTGHDVHRFKLDEEHRFIVSTHRHGGLRVTDMDNDQILFRLPVVRESSVVWDQEFAQVSVS